MQNNETTYIIYTALMPEHGEANINPRKKLSDRFIHHRVNLWVQLRWGIRRLGKGVVIRHHYGLVQMRAILEVIRKFGVRIREEVQIRARHGFANPRGYPGMGGTGTGTGRLNVTHRKPTPVARVWRVFPGTRITKRHMRHISLPPPTSIRPQTQQHAQDMSPNTTTRRWGGGEKDEGGDGLSCPSP